jgi:tetratricopeptide (TPR) repeat protein
MSVDVEAILRTAREAKAAGDLMAAEKILNDAHKAHPEAVEFPAFLGDIRLAQGRAKKAAEAFQFAINLAPEAAILFASLATALESAGDTPGAVEAFAQAVGFEPDNPAFHNNLGLLQRRINKKNEAAKSLEAAVSLAPGNASYHANQARILQDIGDLHAARRAVEKSLELDPQSADALVNYGCILRDLEQPDKAVPALQKATELDPSLQEAWLNLALAYRDTGDTKTGIEAATRLLEINPSHAEAFANLGRFHQELFHYREAEDNYRHALEISPNNPQTLANFSSLLTDMDQLDEAEDLCNKALLINPDHVPALTNLALLVMQRGEFQQSIELLKSALKLEPHNIQVQRNLADPLFMTGRITEAWTAYEYRWKKSDRPRRPHPQPEWMGENLLGKTILVWAEQGIGDTLVFSTCLPDILSVAKKVILEVDHRFVPLYQRSFPDLLVVARQHDPDPLTRTADIDLQCPVGALARWTRPTISSFPDNKSFLQADAASINKWKERLGEMGTARVKAGFFWRSGGDDRTFHSAYPALTDWQPILTRSDVDFISLQYGENQELLTREADRLGMNIHFPIDIDLFDGIDNIAALSAALDCFVGPVTTNCWLAAAVGTPVYVAGLPAEMLLMGTRNFPWLPKVSYIQRPPRGDWEPALKEINSHLDKSVQG